MTFRAEVEQPVDRIAVVALAGELDLYTAPDVEEALLETLSAGARGVVADLADVTFIDSVALGVLLRVAGHLQRIGGRLAVSCPAGVRRFFEVAGVERVVPITETRAEARAAVRPGGGA